MVRVAAARSGGSQIAAAVELLLLLAVAVAVAAVAVAAAAIFAAGATEAVHHGRLARKPLPETLSMESRCIADGRVERRPARCRCAGDRSGVSASEGKSRGHLRT